MGCSHSDGIKFPDDQKACLNREMMMSMRSRMFNRVLRQYILEIKGSTKWKKWKKREHKWFIGPDKGSLPNGKAIVLDGRQKFLGGALFNEGQIYHDKVVCNFKLSGEGQLSIGHMSDKGIVNGFGIRYYPCKKFRGIFYEETEVPKKKFLVVPLP